MRNFGKQECMIINNNNSIFECHKRARKIWIKKQLTIGSCITKFKDCYGKVRPAKALIELFNAVVYNTFIRMPADHFLILPLLLPYLIAGRYITQIFSISNTNDDLMGAIFGLIAGIKKGFNCGHSGLFFARFFARFSTR